MDDSVVMVREENYILHTAQKVNPQMNPNSGWNSDQIPVMKIGECNIAQNPNCYSMTSQMDKGRRKKRFISSHTVADATALINCAGKYSQ